MEDTEIINLFFARSEEAVSQCQRKGPEEEAWQKQPGNYISYGSDQVEQMDVAFLCWEKEGVAYSIMDMGAFVPVETLASMAQELIQG